MYETYTIAKALLAPFNKRSFQSVNILRNSDIILKNNESSWTINFIIILLFQNEQ